MKLYKIGNCLYRLKFPLLPKFINVLIRLTKNSAVFCETKIGKGTIFAYGGIALVIHRRAVIGENCIIGSCVTIGGKSKSIDVPIIGDNCFIASGAKILGDIRIGDNCVIGANAVVVKDVPDNCLVAGIPAKVLKTNINPKDYY